MAIVFILAASSFSCESKAGDPPSKARMEIECGDTYDWGTVRWSDRPLNASIKIYNRGTETLKIKEVKPACGCTAAPLDRNEIEPGDSATLSVSLRFGPKPDKIHKTIDIFSNDPENQKFVLHIKANIVAAFTFFPNKYLPFGLMKLGVEQTVNVVMTNVSEDEVRIEDIEISPTGMKTNLKNGLTIKPNEEFTISASIIPKELGEFKASIRFKTTHFMTNEVVISGSGNVVE